ncbi:major capsid protein [Acinetobacter baumannii]
MTYFSKRGFVKAYPKSLSSVLSPVRVETVIKSNKALSVLLGTGLMVAAGSAFAEGLAAGATPAITAGSTDLQTVGIAIITVVAGVWVIKRVIALIR